MDGLSTLISKKIIPRREQRGMMAFSGKKVAFTSAWKEAWGQSGRAGRSPLP
jgi:hypothetical protein